MNTNTTNYDTWIDSEVVDTNGDKIGKVSDVFYDDVSNRPEWLAVKTGLFGTNSTFVPIQGSSLASDGRIMVAYPKDTVKNAPNVAEGANMTAQEEQALWSYYGYDHTDRSTGYGYGGDRNQRADKDFSWSRYDTNAGDWGEERQHAEVVGEATAVSEEATKREVPQTVRLRKYRRTEMVPVNKEEIRVEKD